MNKNANVDEYLEKLENQLKNIWEHIREIILGVDDKIEEDIKYISVLMPMKI